MDSRQLLGREVCHVAYDVASRGEVKEETGVDIELTAVAGATEFHATGYWAAVLLMEVKATSEHVQLSDEHDKYEWIPRAQLDDYTFSGDLQAFLRSVVGRAQR